jgi:hypothetical protein
MKRTFAAAAAVATLLLLAGAAVAYPAHPALTKGAHVATARLHGTYTVTVTARTDANQKAFTSCWGARAGLTDAQWDELTASKTHADVERFYAVHPQARAAFKSCLRDVPRVLETRTETRTY